MPKSATAPAAHTARAAPTSTCRRLRAKESSAGIKRCQRSPDRSAERVGVRKASCSAGNSVKATIQEMRRPSAVQIPISRMGRSADTESEANPSTAAAIEAVTGKSLLRSAASWCAPSSRPAGLSTKRECR